ncbi:cyclin-dependent kinase 12-like isoform X1 [Branchiostoma lanceolatum]|uniref:cyclin-dependent kinase 12-like isoform X1 n=1 Tax=Branchiostoma lanceolatum TaxID=7740 RepID=UPI0034555CF1
MSWSGQDGVDDEFVLHGRKTPIRDHPGGYFTNSQKTITTQDLTQSRTYDPGNYRPSSKTAAMRTYRSDLRRSHSEEDLRIRKTKEEMLQDIFKAEGRALSPSVYELEKSLTDLRLDLSALSNSGSFGKGQLNKSVSFSDKVHEKIVHSDSEDSVDEELRRLIDRDDEEASTGERGDGDIPRPLHSKNVTSHEYKWVSDKPAAAHDKQWYTDPKHLTSEVGYYPTLQEGGVPPRSVSPVNRTIGRFGSEIADKSAFARVTPTDIASSATSYPVRLQAPYIIGVKSLRQPKIQPRPQSPVRALSPALRMERMMEDVEQERGRSRSRTRTSLRTRSTSPALRQSRGRLRSRSSSLSRGRSPSPAPAWKPVLTVKKEAPIFLDDSPLPRKPQRKFSLRQSRSKSKKFTWNSTTPLPEKPMNADSALKDISKQFLESLEPETRKYLLEQSIKNNTPLLAEADKLSGRTVSDSPWEKELARLRLERLRIEEEHLLELKREDELERIRGPMPKCWHGPNNLPSPAWYEMKTSQFHYEAKKNNKLLKNSKHWQGMMDYRQELLNASREFSQSVDPHASMGIAL